MKSSDRGESARERENVCPSAALSEDTVPFAPVNRCRQLASPQAYTPKHLAEKILTSRSALEGERKQVTVLFCDLADSTALAERLGKRKRRLPWSLWR